MNKCTINLFNYKYSFLQKQKLVVMKKCFDVEIIVVIINIDCFVARWIWILS